MEPFIGQIMAFGGNFAPRGWAFCDGALLAISSNSALFSILGTIYGGDGRTTFALPDLRGRVPMHEGHGPGLSNFKLGQKSGHETVTLTTLQLPSHNHSLAGAKGTLQVNEEDGAVAESKGNTMGSLSSGELFNTDAPDSAMRNGNVLLEGNTLNTGNQQPFDIHQPYLAINFIIALQGTFPSRS